MRGLGVDPALDRVAAKLELSWETESCSPAAIRTCSRTMSMPVTISVTQCSTWTRVFISRKKYSSPTCIPSIVPAPL